MRVPAIQTVVDKAEAFVGYTAMAGKKSQFGVPGLNWDGAFIDAVFADSEFLVPNHQNTGSALAFYFKTNRIFTKPKIGDVVFFAFPPQSGDISDAPHVGIVTDLGPWKEHRTFRSIEGQISSGLPRGSQDPNGIYVRTRHQSDVLAFARPIKKDRIFKQSRRITGMTDEPAIRTSHLTKCTTPASAKAARPEIRRSVELVQIALSMHPAVMLSNADRGVFNGKTRRALSAFQRYHGWVDADGTPDVQTLRALADETGNFFHVGE